MRIVLICRAVTGMALLLSVQAAGAHGIAGNRFFVGTLTFDDPSVADEAIVPNFSTLLFFLDDLIPKPFDTPLLSNKTDRSLIAWH
jgi:hypothetical protein